MSRLKNYKFVAAVLILALALSAIPTPEQTVCYPETIDCGFAAGGIDSYDLRKLGVPFAAFEIKTARGYTADYGGVVNSKSYKIKPQGLMNIIPATFIISVIYLIFIKSRKK